MKKISLLLAIVMLLSSFVIFASAEIDTSKFECIDDIVYFENRLQIKAGEIIEQSGDSSLVVISKDGKVFASDENVPNGAYVAVMENGEVTEKVQICVKEDVNCDGRVTAADARLALRTSAKLEKLEGVYATAAEVTGDGKINASDARKILRISAGLEE